VCVVGFCLTKPPQLNAQGTIRIFHGIKLRSMSATTAVAALAEDLREFNLAKGNSGGSIHT